MVRLQLLAVVVSECGLCFSRTNLTVDRRDQTGDSVCHEHYKSKDIWRSKHAFLKKELFMNY